MSESLQLTVGSINLVRDTAGFLSTMSPYVKIEYGEQNFETKTKFDGGKECTFDETFDLGDGT